MGLFDKLAGSGVAQPAQITPDMMRQEIGNIQQNPSAYLAQRGFRVPENIRDPKELTQYLLRTGQIGGGRLQQIIRMLGGMK